MKLLRFLQATALISCQTCINRKGILSAYGGEIKAVSISNDENGILFTIRCDFPDLNPDNPEILAKTKNLLDKIMEEDRQHLIVLQR